MKSESEVVDVSVLCNQLMRYHSLAAYIYVSAADQHPFRHETPSVGKCIARTLNNFVQGI